MIVLCRMVMQNDRVVCAESVSLTVTEEHEQYLASEHGNFLHYMKRDEDVQDTLRRWDRPETQAVVCLHRRKVVHVVRSNRDLPLEQMQSALVAVNAWV